MSIQEHSEVYITFSENLVISNTFPVDVTRNFQDEIADSDSFGFVKQWRHLDPVARAATFFMFML